MAVLSYKTEFYLGRFYRRKIFAICEFRCIIYLELFNYPLTCDVGGLWPVAGMP